MSTIVRCQTQAQTILETHSVNKPWREGAGDCKLHWHPMFYKDVVLFVDPKTEGTFIEF